VRVGGCASQRKCARHPPALSCSPFGILSPGSSSSNSEGLRRCNLAVLREPPEGLREGQRAPRVGRR
jgi:hypothetical protein